MFVLLLPFLIASFQTAMDAPRCNPLPLIEADRAICQAMIGGPAIPPAVVPVALRQEYRFPSTCKLGLLAGMEGSLCKRWADQ